MYAGDKSQKSPLVLITIFLVAMMIMRFSVNAGGGGALVSEDRQTGREGGLCIVCSHSSIYTFLYKYMITVSNI